MDQPEPAGMTLEVPSLHQFDQHVTASRRIVTWQWAAIVAALVASALAVLTSTDVIRVHKPPQQIVSSPTTPIVEKSVVSLSESDRRSVAKLVPRGRPGKDGKSGTRTIIKTLQPRINNVTRIVQGTRGPPGPQGPQGRPGRPGVPGLTPSPGATLAQVHQEVCRVLAPLEVQLRPIIHISIC